MNAKEYRATLGRKPVIGLFSVGVEEAYRWKDSVQSPDEIRLWVADLVANGMRPWYSKFAGTLHDERWLKPVEQLYLWCHGAERYLRNERPLARVGLVYSQQTGLVHWRRSLARARRGSRARLVSGARRGPRAVRDGARPEARRREPRGLAHADPAERRGAVGRAVRAAG
jgi:hypothetical protein